MGRLEPIDEEIHSGSTLNIVSPTRASNLYITRHSGNLVRGFVNTAGRGKTCSLLLMHVGLEFLASGHDV